jgi:protein ImuB
MKGGLRLTGIDAAAAVEGLRPGMPLADARALMPHLAVAAAEPEADAASLGCLADWCGRWTPWAATDGADGITLDISGCAHLFGGEAALHDQIADRLRRLGFTVRIALADTPAAAWAWARYGAGGVLAPGAQTTALGLLPVAALRLPAALTGKLERLGVRTIAELAGLPRAALTRRFGKTLPMRLDQAFGRGPEPIGPRSPLTDWSRRRSLAEPIARREDVEAGLRLLLDDLAVGLSHAHRGVRQLVLRLYRVDGSTQDFAVGTARPSRDPRYLCRLFAEPFGRLDTGFGIEAMVLGATVTEPLPPRQRDWQVVEGEPDALIGLIDRLRQRLGTAAVVRPSPVESHWPEHAAVTVPALAPPGRSVWQTPSPRPIRLLPVPEPVEVTVAAPDDPPLAFRWRHLDCRIARCEGPERIAPEWWRAPVASHGREYWRIEDEQGRRYWLFRVFDGPSGQPAAWYLHGLFP